MIKYATVCCPMSYGPEINDAVSTLNDLARDGYHVVSSCPFNQGQGVIWTLEKIDVKNWEHLREDLR